MKAETKYMIGCALGIIFTIARVVIGWQIVLQLMDGRIEEIIREMVVKFALQETYSLTK